MLLKYMGTNVMYIEYLDNNWHSKRGNETDNRKVLIKRKKREVDIRFGGDRNKGGFKIKQVECMSRPVTASDNGQRSGISVSGEETVSRAGEDIIGGHQSQG